MIRRPGGVLDAFQLKPVAKLLRALVAIDGDFVIHTPAAYALDHNAVAAARGNGRRHDGVGDPVNVHWRRTIYREQSISVHRQLMDDLADCVPPKANWLPCFIGKVI